PYRSVVPLVSGEIGTDVASYLVASEQTPSVVAIGVFVNPDGRVGAAGGYLLQAMPGADGGLVERLEANVGAAAPPSELVRGALCSRGVRAARGRADRSVVQISSAIVTPAPPRCGSESRNPAQ